MPSALGTGSRHGLYQIRLVWRLRFPAFLGNLWNAVEQEHELTASVRSNGSYENPFRLLQDLFTMTAQRMT